MCTWFLNYLGLYIGTLNQKERPYEPPVANSWLRHCFRGLGLDPLLVVTQMHYSPNAALFLAYFATNYRSMYTCKHKSSFRKYRYAISYCILIDQWRRPNQNHRNWTVLWPNATHLQLWCSDILVCFLRAECENTLNSPVVSGTVCVWRTHMWD